MDVTERSTTDADETKPASEAPREPLVSLLDALTDGLTTGLVERERRGILATAATPAAAESTSTIEPAEPAALPTAPKPKVADEPQAPPAPIDPPAERVHPSNERALPPAAVLRTAARPVRRRGARRTGLFVVLAALFAAGIVIAAGIDWLHWGAGRSRTTPIAVAPSRAPGTPAIATAKPTPFGWPTTANATYYRVRFFRAGREVFEARPTQPRIVLPTHWRFAGHAERLTPGMYHWIAEPGFGLRSAHKYGRAIVDANWMVR